MNATYKTPSAFSIDNKCFNGKFLVEYQLNQLLDTQKLWLKHGLKFVTLLETNINHNIKHTHVKHMDQPLRKYLSNIIKNDDVITVILSDHGNKFGLYMNLVFPEGATDRYHPFAFVILPEKENRYFTDVELKNLESNQDKMVTAQDLHYLLSKFSVQGDEEQSGDTNIFAPKS